MRSIRRSMMVYLLGMLVFTLAGIAVVIDRVAEGALAAREEAGHELISRQYDERFQREIEATNESLRNEARTLYGLMAALNQKSWITNYLLRIASSQLFRFTELVLGWGEGVPSPPFALPTAGRNGPPLPTIVADTTRRLSQEYFANQPLPVDDIQHVSEDSMAGASKEKPDYQQINELINDSVRREWHSVSLGGRKFPFDARDLDAKFPDHGKSPDSLPAFDFANDDDYLDIEPVHRVILKAPHLGYPGRRPGAPPGGGDGPRASGPPRPPFLIDTANLPRLYIQCARPKAVIEARLASFAEQRDNDLAILAQDVRGSRTLMRLKMLAVGLIAVVAVCLGGPLIVGAGLRPVGRLSAAVNQVSEKDFKLPHDGSDLAHELVPIHSGLTQTLDLLRRAFAREKQAVADISHELRTPIAALMATIDVALRKPRTPEQYRVTLEDCRTISKELGQLVERIMTLATLDAGNDRTLVSRVDATDVAAACAAVIRPLAEANGVTVQVHRPDSAVELDTDPAKLREVLMNLLHNAVEYNRPAGTIDLAIRQESETAVFEVRDTGIGMTPEIRERIFERFFRADPSRHATGVHAGLGLAIVKEYVARLEGTIAVESAPGVGTTFRVVLPATSREEPATGA